MKTVGQNCVDINRLDLDSAETLVYLELIGVLARHWKLVRVVGRRVRRRLR